MLSKSGVRTTRKELQQKALQQRRAYIVPTQYEALSALDLYATFLGIAADEKGTFASSIALTGFRVQINLSFDPMVFVLPGLIEIPIEVSGGTDIGSGTVFLLHRSMPPRLTSPPPNATIPASIIWNSDTPVSLMSLVGKAYAVQLSGSIGVFFIQEFPEEESLPGGEPAANLTITELPLLIQLGIEVGNNYQYDTLYAIDRLPGWYPHIRDSHLSNDFERLLFPANPTVAKEEVLKWLENFDDTVFKLSTKDTKLSTEDINIAIAGTSAQKNDLYTRFLQQQEKIISPEKQRKRDKWLKVVKSKAKKIKETATQKIPFYQKLKEPLTKMLTKDISIPYLVKYLQGLQFLLPPEPFIDNYYPYEPDNAEFIKTSLADISAQIDTHIRMLQNAQTHLMLTLDEFDIIQKHGSYTYHPMTSGSPIDLHHCFLKIATHADGVQANVKARILGTGGDGGVTARFKRSAYRYQTYTPPSGKSSTLIYTQDTKITYRQVTGNLSAGVTLYERSKEKNLKVNSITYRSACAYWLYPSESGTSDQWITPQLGSGVSFGMSVYTKDFITCCEQLRVGKLDPTYQRFLNKISKRLKIPRTNLNWFLENPKYMLETMAYVNQEMFLLESSFFLPPQWSILSSKKPVKGSGSSSPPEVFRLHSFWDQSYPTPVGNAPSPFQALWKAIDQELANPNSISSYLQSIRIRIRRADYRESAATFKLGVSVPGTGTQVGIRLGEISKVGTHGMWDIFTSSFNSEDADTRVPPVVLLYQ